MRYAQFSRCVAVLAILTFMLVASAAANDDTTNPAVVPTERPEGWAQQRHQAINDRVKQGNVDLIFVGDSITQGWEGPGQEVWKKYYGNRNAANLGIGSDHTQHVLWRLDHGNVDGISSKLAVVLIGVNNVGMSWQPAEPVAEGIKAVVEKLRAKLPQTKILLLAIFPCHADRYDKVRQVSAKVNQIISKLADGKNVFYLDIGNKFLNADETISPDIMPDTVHLSEKGFQIWAEAIEPMVAELMGEKSGSVTLVEDGKAVAMIVTAKNPTPAANLAALELQHHIKKITGAELPIKTDADEVNGCRILVGASEATERLGLREEDFAPQEYLIRFLPETIVLMGRDWHDTEANRKEVGQFGDVLLVTLQDVRHQVDYSEVTEQGATAPKNVIELPGLFDDQATCYAAYDFLERFCDVRWYGPTELNVVCPQMKTLALKGNEIRRSPAMKYREGWGQKWQFGDWPIMKDQWNNANHEQQNLYWRRMRAGGEKFFVGHSFMSYQDRFMPASPQSPLFESAHPEYFAQGQEDNPNVSKNARRQLCYTNPGFIQQVIQDARDYFDGKGLKGDQLAVGDYFCIVPMDSVSWCKCPQCTALLEKDKDKNPLNFFANGTASTYWFTFVNAVAREIRKTHPDKFISTAAYWAYSYYPEDMKLEPNVAVALCLPHGREPVSPTAAKNDLDILEHWTGKMDTPVYLWDYYCWPVIFIKQAGPANSWNCFPAFRMHSNAKWIKEYRKAGVRGVFLCGLGDQMDYYCTMKMYDDDTFEIDPLLDEFFTRYFGKAGEPMEKFYQRIEEIYTDPANYPSPFVSEEIFWKYLGTAERMQELGALLEQAKQCGGTDVEKKRLDTWLKVWDYMVEGRDKYLAKVAEEQKKDAGNQ